MKTETFESGVIISRMIATLKHELLNYSDERYVYFHIYDHYGNRSGSVIRTYALPFELDAAMGDDLAHFIPEAYGDFLAAVRNRIMNRINELEIEFENL